MSADNFWKRLLKFFVLCLKADAELNDQRQGRNSSNPQLRDYEMSDPGFDAGAIDDRMSAGDPTAGIDSNRW